MSQNKPNRRVSAAARFMGIAGGVVVALVARVAVVQMGGEFYDDPRNAFVRGAIDTDVRYPSLVTSDGVLVAKSVPVHGHMVRRYVYPDLAPLVGVMPRGGAPVGVERRLALRGGDPGTPVALTVDSRIQAAAARSLEGKAGSVLVLDTSGAVLAAADTSTKPVAAPDRIAAGDWTKPDGPFAFWPRGAAPVLFDRPVAAGSTLKPFIYAAAVDAEIVRADEKFPARRGYAPSGGRWISNYASSLCPAGNVVDGIARSCNSTAVEIGSRLGPAHLRQALEGFGFGRPPADDLAASVPALQSGWPSTVDETSLATIGQGESRVTLLGLALAYASLATGKAPPTPRLFIDDPVKDIGVDPVQPAGRDAALEGMRAAADHGTARQLNDLDVAAKTGTATRSNRGDSDGWTVALYPRSNPRYIIIVRLDGGLTSASGGDAVAVTRVLLIAATPLLKN